MFRLPTRSYTFPYPPDSHWIPSRYSLFEEEPTDRHGDPPPQEPLLVHSQRLRVDWDDREYRVKRLRAELACTIVFFQNMSIDFGSRHRVQ
jgi:hypothetical protein